MNAQEEEHRILELDQRSGEGTVVTLFWSRRTGTVFVSVEDTATNVEFHFPVEPANALDAFHHPYAYSGRRWQRPVRGSEPVGRHDAMH
jgi:hypothetical protein